MITATPNPVPEGEGEGTTVVAWDTGGDTDGQVYVSVDQGEEKLFAAGPGGEKQATWIGLGRTYHFRLYEGKGRARLLGSVSVRKKYGTPRVPAKDMAHGTEDGPRPDLVDNERIRLLLSFTLAEDSNCIDVGGCRGVILRHIVHYAPKGRHIVYEPLPHLCEELQRQFPDVEVRQVALSNKSGEADFVHVKNLPGYSGLLERSYPEAVDLQRIRVRTEALDEALPEDYVPALIKVDVEGAEQLVLEGAIGTLEAHRPTVVFEHGRGAAERYGTTPGMIFDLLKGVGLRIFDLDGNGPYTSDDFVATYERGARLNWVARR